MDDVDDSYFDWSDEDDIICSSRYIISSDEDEDDYFIIPTTKKSEKALCSTNDITAAFSSREKQQGKVEEDDFEKEMALELSQTVQQMATSFSLPCSTNSAAPKKNAPEFYDDVYFDSDESDTEEVATTGRPPGGEKRRHKVISNDELFYDPGMDDRDQEWVDRKRRSYQPKGKRGRENAGNKSNITLPQSDAVLNCPACLTTLCMDCQRHEIYHNQYRAMFVFNCIVDVTERLKYPSKDQKKREFLKSKKTRKNKLHGTEESSRDQVVGDNKVTVAEEASSGGSDLRRGETATNSSKSTADVSSTKTLPANKTDGGSEEEKEVFHPVKCKICNTKVAVYDSDEVYHFFNVVTSY